MNTSTDKTSDKAARGNATPLIIALVIGAALATGAHFLRDRTPAPARGTSASTPKTGEATTPVQIPVTLRGKTMGTTYAVKVLLSPAQTGDVPALQAAVDEVLERVNDDMSTWRKESDLSKLNAHAGTDPYAARPATAKLVDRALHLGQKTGGAFDITLGPLIRLWGFGRDGRRDRPPTDKDLATARAKVGLDKLIVDGNMIRKTAADVDVSLAGIAKGYGVDEVGQMLNHRGIKHALVEIGGEVRGYGKTETGRAWRVGVNVPRAAAGATDVAVAIPLENAALATSGDYRNFFESGGKRYGHILDPRTGRPVEHTVLSASVLAKDCETADALATAMLVLGREEGRKVVDAWPGVEALFLEDDGAGGFTVTQTDGFPRPK